MFVILVITNTNLLTLKNYNYGYFNMDYIRTNCRSNCKAIHPGSDPGGWIATIIIGIIGAVVGGWLGSMIFGVDVTGFNISSF